MSRTLCMVDVLSSIKKLMSPSASCLPPGAGTHRHCPGQAVPAIRRPSLPLRAHKVKGGGKVEGWPGRLPQLLLLEERGGGRTSRDRSSSPSAPSSPAALPPACVSTRTPSDPLPCSSAPQSCSVPCATWKGRGGAVLGSRGDAPQCRQEEHSYQPAKRRPPPACKPQLWL